jgi:hypothetical protein
MVRGWFVSYPYDFDTVRLRYQHGGVGNRLDGVFAIDDSHRDRANICKRVRLSWSCNGYLTHAGERSIEAIR